MSDTTKSIDPKVFSDPGARKRILRAAGLISQQAKRGKAVDARRDPAKMREIGLADGMGVYPEKGSITAKMVAEERREQEKLRLEAMLDETKRQVECLSEAGPLPSKADQLPEFGQIRVGANDVLVVTVDVQDISSNQVETFLNHIKNHLGDFFEKRGLKDRVLWVADRHSGSTKFSVISIEETRKMTESKRDVPVIG